ncbi:hypothetical protein CAPTEDRAFT_218499 [Capitella teleta]|uniref:N-acetyltransferase domain-containing protein n=1 Tax=Capitella teleta TaxID=283909 RepID=R7VJD6_CAPTE|nr:hypothetical protein CAPTEDRAFT_218499 [Capitella teleta]|eukprot:ELU18769.1 hypothetical protein CAPTEDRAFT_218499 [Capitella teleta]
MEDTKVKRRRKRSRGDATPEEDGLKTLPVKLDDLEMKPETLGEEDMLDIIPEDDVEEDDLEEVKEEEEEGEKVVVDPKADDKDRLKLSILELDDEEAARWLVYKRIFVSDAYSMAMDNILTTNFACICFGVFSLAFNYVGLIKAFFVVFLGVPMFLIIICRTIVLWKLIVKSGPDIRVGIHEYWIRGNASRSIFTAKYESRVVGTVAVVALSKRIAEITRVATDKDCGRKGVGSCLMQYVLKICQSSGFEEVVLTVGESNYPACVLFEKFGFRVSRQVQDSFFRFLKWKGFVMKLKLLPEKRDGEKEEEKEKSQGRMKLKGVVEEEEEDVEEKNKNQLASHEE